MTMAALYNFQFSTIQTSVTFFLFDFDRVCAILRDLIRACISDSLAFSVATPLIFISWLGSDNSSA